MVGAPVPGESTLPEWGCPHPGFGADISGSPGKPDEGMSTMHDPIHASDDTDETLAAAEAHLLAADAADMHRLLAWYYGSDEPTGPHLPYPQVEEAA